VTKQGKTTVEVVYLITSAETTAAPPATLAVGPRPLRHRDATALRHRRHLWTGHLHRPHRTVTPGHGKVMATLRNTAISLLRLAGWDNIAKALRHHPRDPERALTCLLTC